MKLYNPKKKEHKQATYNRIKELTKPLYRHFEAYENYEEVYCPIIFVYNKILEHVKGNITELPKNIYIIKTKAEAIKHANITGNILMEVDVIDEKGIPASEYTKNKYWVEIPWKDAKIHKTKKQEAVLIPGTIEFTLLNPYWEGDQNIKRVILPKEA